MTIFTARNTITAARLGLATLPATPSCACCGDEMPDAADRAESWLDLDGVAEAQEHYGKLCVGCFEDFPECTCCGKRRHERDMWRLGDNPVCSATCDLNLEFDNTAEDNRLTWRDVM